MEYMFWIIFALGLFFIYIVIMSVHDEIKRKRWALRFQWGYAKSYHWYKKFDSGYFTIGPVLFYKKGAIIYYRQRISREAFDLLSVQDISTFMYENAKTQLKASIPYDFEFKTIIAYEDYDIDRGIHRVTVEGYPILIEEN